MAQSVDTFILPDLHALHPFKGGQNPLFEVVRKESRDWINSFEILPENLRAGFTATYGELLASYTYPYAPHAVLRVCADFVNVLFTLDEVSDDQGPEAARETINLFLRALRYEPDLDDGSPLAKMLISFADRLKKVVAPNCQRRFYKTNVDYVEAVKKEAEYRASGKAVDLEYYHYVRRGNSGVLAAFTLFEPGLGIDLPDEVVDHPAFEEISIIGMDIICWANDLYSYNMEQSREIDASNIITILREHKGYTLQQAVDHVGEMFSDLVKRHLEARRAFPSFGPEIDSAVSKYFDAIETWVVGNLDWSFASKRYFGEASDEVKKARIVTLYPRKSEVEKQKKAAETADKVSEATSAERAG